MIILGGWIKLYRKTEENPIVMKDADHLAIWCYFLMEATHSEFCSLFGKEKIKLEAGQFITGRKKIASLLNISESKVRRVMEDFKKDQQIAIETCTQSTLVTMLNWSTYQCCDQTSTNEKPTSDQRATEMRPLYKNNKNNKNIKNEINNNIYVEIVAYLNEKAGTNFRSSSASTQRHINARLNEGYTVDDFKKVIDNKVADWKSNDKMSKYLAPDTLFSNKFEKYLQEKPAVVREGYAPDIDPKWLGLG